MNFVAIPPRQHQAAAMPPNLLTAELLDRSPDFLRQYCDTEIIFEDIPEMEAEECVALLAIFRDHAGIGSQFVLLDDLSNADLSRLVVIIPDSRGTVQFPQEVPRNPAEAGVPSLASCLIYQLFASDNHLGQRVLDIRLLQNNIMQPPGAPPETCRTGKIGARNLAGASGCVLGPQREGHQVAA
jgi:hypothetical protein